MMAPKQVPFVQKEHESVTVYICHFWRAYISFWLTAQHAFPCFRFQNVVPLHCNQGGCRWCTAVCLTTPGTSVKGGTTPGLQRKEDYMSVFYRLSQVKGENARNRGKWYAKAVITETVDINKLATIMQRNCTLKKSDIVAVIAELIETMADVLQDSKRVHLNGFGAFKLGISSKGIDEADDYDVRKHVKNVHVVFQPETKIAANGNRSKTFINGCTVVPVPQVNEEKPEENGGD